MNLLSANGDGGSVEFQMKVQIGLSRYTTAGVSLLTSKQFFKLSLHVLSLILKVSICQFVHTEQWCIIISHSYINHYDQILPINLM